MYRQSFRASALVGAVLAAFVLPAHAAPVVSASSAASAGGDVAAPVNNPGPPVASSYAAQSNSFGVGEANSFASEGGAYAVRASAEGKAFGGSSASFLYEFENTTGVAQHYMLSFYIYGGSISTQVNDPDGLLAAESLSANYAAYIYVGNTAVFSSTSSISRLGNTITHDKSGADLNTFDDGSDGYYSWGGSFHQVDLGIVAAGGTLSVLAQVSDTAFADVGTYTFTSGGSCYDYYGYTYPCCPTEQGQTGAQTLVASECTGTRFKGSSGAFYGDPALINGDPGALGAFFFNNVPAAIPEPATWSLGVLALAGLALRRRRR